MGVTGVRKWRRYQVVTVIIVALVGALFLLSWKQDVDQRAYENSPEGKAEALKRNRESEEAADVMVAKAMVQGWLRDPDSAQFIGVHTVHRNGVKAVCGFVNARNGFGGMTGNEAFVVIGANAIMAGSASAKEEAELNKLCFGR